MSDDWKVLRSKWLKVKKILRDDPQATVPCPECGHWELTVMDQQPPDGELQRHALCPGCGAVKEVKKPRGAA